MTLTAVGAGGSSTTVNAEVNLLIDTQTVVYSPVSVVSGSVTIQGADHLPPRTQLVVSTPTFGQNPIFVSSRTFFSFNAVDDKSTVGDGQGVGVKDTQVAVDSAPFTVITGTFNITAEGLHMIRWFSEDLVGNVEVVHSSSVFVDNTPPATQIAFSAPPFVSVSSQVYISSGTRISFSAQDAGSGVAFTQFQVDGGTFQRFSSSFTLAEGIHVIAFRSQDNVANLEPPQNSTVQVDGTPPVSVRARRA